MNLTEKLIKADKSALKERNRKQLYSRRLSKLVGEESFLTIQQVPGRRLYELVQMDNKYDANVLLCAEAIIEPSMKDTALMESFGVKTPKDLAEKLFDMETSPIADEVIAMSPLDGVREKDIKKPSGGTETQP